MSENDDISNTFWGRFKTSEELEDFFRPTLEKAAAAQDKIRAQARAIREAAAASDGLAYLQPRAWMILDVDSRPVHEDFFETSEHAEKHLADLLDELAGVMMLEKLTSQLRLVTDEGEGEGEEALKAEARRMAEKVCASLNIVHAYL